MPTSRCSPRTDTERAVRRPSHTCAVNKSETSPFSPHLSHTHTHTHTRDHPTSGALRSTHWWCEACSVAATGAPGGGSGNNTALTAAHHGHRSSHSADHVLHLEEEVRRPACSSSAASSAVSCWSGGTLALDPIRCARQSSTPTVMGGMRSDHRPQSAPFVRTPTEEKLAR